MKNKSDKTIVLHDNSITEAVYEYEKLELNTFISIIQKYNQAEGLEVTFSIKEIKEISGANNRNYEIFENICTNLMTKPIQVRKGDKRIKMILFPTITFDDKEKTIKIKINEDCLPLVNNLKANFTVYYVEDFRALNTVYSKSLFPLLMQYKVTGFRSFLVKDFREYLNIPKSYNMQKINERIINPSVKEINEKTDFSISIEKKYIKNSVSEIIFYINSKIKISDELSLEIISARKNIFIGRVLKDSHIICLLQEFSEAEIIKALNIARKEANKEINSIVAYLKQVIKTPMKSHESKYTDFEKKEKIKAKQEKDKATEQEILDKKAEEMLETLSKSDLESIDKEYSNLMESFRAKISIESFRKTKIKERMTTL